MEIILYPLDKVILDGKEIKLGMKKSLVEEEIGKGEILRERHYYFNSEMALDYDSKENVEFIEFLGGIDGHLKPMIYGVSAFESDADKLIEILTQQNSSHIVDDEDGYSYAFVNIGVGVYREIRPIDILEMMDEMKEDGILVENNEDFETDRRRAGHWATIGIGIKGYYW